MYMYTCTHQVKIKVFWDVTPCSLVDKKERYLRANCCLELPHLEIFAYVFKADDKGETKLLQNINKP
jgi:hypothetical protein